MTAAHTYRAACAVNSGASTRCRDTPTLLPTNAMPAAPATTARQFGARPTDSVTTPP